MNNFNNIIIKKNYKIGELRKELTKYKEMYVVQIVEFLKEKFTCLKERLRHSKLNFYYLKLKREINKWVQKAMKD